MGSYVPNDTEAHETFILISSLLHIHLFSLRMKVPLQITAEPSSSSLHVQQMYYRFGKYRLPCSGFVFSSLCSPIFVCRVFLLL